MIKSSRYDICKKCDGHGGYAMSVNCVATYTKCEECHGLGSIRVDPKTRWCIIIEEENYVTRPDSIT